MNAAAASPQWGKTDSFLALIFVGLCACMVALGCWQLMRAEEKRSMLAREAESAAAAAVPLQAVLPDIATAATHYTRVVLTGEWLPKQQLLWDNRIALGVAGYEVLTPFKLESGEVVLVNRGWVPVGTSRTLLPDVSGGVGDAVPKLTIEGVLNRPSKGLGSGPAVEPSSTWPKRLQFVDYAALNREYAYPLVPAIVQARAVGEPITESWHLLGNWQPTERFGPSRHLGYAVQWFAMAIALTCLYFWHGLRRFRPKNRKLSNLS